MKILKAISFIILLFVQSEIFAQDTIYVSYNKETAIQFPSSITSPVIADKNLVAQIKDDNFLSLKATGKNFYKSSLLVNTIDGMSYRFPVSFSYGRAGRLNRLPELKGKESPISETPSSNAVISKKIAETRNSRTVSKDKSSKIKSNLGNITISGDNLFYRLKIKNRSNINFDIDFIRFYIRDIKTAKRTVTQEQEIYPVYTYGINSKIIEGKSTGLYVFALNKFPLTNHQVLSIEVYEKDGSRHQYLKAKQSDIQKARLYK